MSSSATEPIGSASHVLHGIAYITLSEEQRGHLLSLVRHYIERMADELSVHVWARLERTGLDELIFAGAGSQMCGIAREPPAKIRMRACGAQTHSSPSAVQSETFL